MIQCEAVVKANYGYFNESKIETKKVLICLPFLKKEELHIVPKQLMIPVLSSSFYFFSFSVSLETFYIYINSFTRCFYPM